MKQSIGRGAEVGSRQRRGGVSHWGIRHCTQGLCICTGAQGIRARECCCCIEPRAQESVHARVRSVGRGGANQSLPDTHTPVRGHFDGLRRPLDQLPRIAPCSRGAAAELLLTHKQAIEARASLRSVSASGVFLQASVWCSLPPPHSPSAKDVRGSALRVSVRCRLLLRTYSAPR